MSDSAAAERALEQVRELEDIVGRLKGVKGEVSGFDIHQYEDAGSAQWAGERRNRFTAQFETTKTSYRRIADEIDQAISDVKSKQRSLAWSINGFEHPILAAQAHALAL